MRKIALAIMLVVCAVNCNAQSLGYLFGVLGGDSQSKEQEFQDALKKANKGDGAAMKSVGFYYMYGEGVAEDKKKAVDWFRKAIDYGYWYALYDLGDCYENGDGVTRSYTEAAKLYRMAYYYGYRDFPAECLGRLYEKGLGVTQSYIEAARWYKRSYNGRAEIALGDLYLKGLGVEKSVEKAIEYYERSSGEHTRYTRLFELYYYGKYVTKDYSKAADYLIESCYCKMYEDLTKEYLEKFPGSLDTAFLKILRQRIAANEKKNATKSDDPVVEERKQYSLTSTKLEAILRKRGR